MRKLLVLLCFVSASLFGQGLEEQTYRNPVIAIDIPDPTVIRVGNDYYAAGTTSDFAPNYPLYHSKDLINWERIGAVFHEPPTWIKGDCWAPELYYHNDTFYMYYTARKKSNNITCIGVATTKDLLKGFTDHGPLIEWGNEAIDAYVFKDDDGKLYITWKAYGLDNRPIEILASELSPDGLSLKGEHFTLTNPKSGWIERGDEGQCIVKRNGYYYLFYSIGGCCDNRCSYRVHVSRSKDLRGEWEQYEPNAILEGGGAWKCSGHGTLVQTPDGRYFYLYHAYNAYDFEFVGRQGMLDELSWDDEIGWPYFKYGNNPTVQAPVPFKGTVQKRNVDIIVDDFSADKYSTYWQWDMNLGKPDISKENKGLILENKKDGLCFWGVNSQTGTYAMETAVINTTDHFKGLSVYGGPNDSFAWGISGSEIKLIKIEGGKKTEVFSQRTEHTGTVYLKIEALGARLYRFLWSTNNKDWKRFPENNKQHIEGTFLPQWGKGLRVGFLLEGKDKGVFQYFRLVNK